jgi:hypothetical protein
MEAVIVSDESGKELMTIHAKDILPDIWKEGRPGKSALK